MSRKEYDTFILTELNEVPEDQEIELIIRDLSPEDRRYKYRSTYAWCLISRDESKYPDRLWIRLGRGQLQEKPWSIKVLKEIKKISED